MVPSPLLAYRNGEREAAFKLSSQTKIATDLNRVLFSVGMTDFTPNTAGLAFFLHPLSTSQMRVSVQEWLCHISF